jgi:hypothetical protein
MVGALTSTATVAVLAILSQIALTCAQDIQILYDRRVAAINGSTDASKSKIDGL